MTEADIFFQLWGHEKPQLGLERVRAVSRELSNPEKSFKAIIIAGTNGKGTTAFYTARALSLSSYKVGLFTSPHLITYRERIRILKGDGEKKIAPHEASALAEEVRRAQERAGVKLTYFEALTLAAFLHFARERVDFAVLEVGLGGRLDATNIAHPVACAITRISIDHTQYLGARIPQIAYEKGGIIRGGIPVFTTSTGLALSTLKKISSHRKAPLFESGKDFTYFKEEGKLTVNTGNAEFKIKLPELFPEFLSENLCLAVAVTNYLIGEKEKLNRALNRMSLSVPGRFQIVRDTPLWIFDGAHNPHATARVVSELKKMGLKVDVVIFSKLTDKSPLTLKAISRLSRNLHLCNIESTPRYTSAYELAKYAEEMQFSKVEIYKNVYHLPWPKYLKENKTLLLTGSMVLVGEALLALVKKGLLPDKFKMI